MIQYAALLYAVFCGGVILFQLCLISGAPWGRLTQGGAHPEALPRSGKAIAAISILLLVLMTMSLLSAAGMSLRWPRWMGWGALGITAISMLLNWITPSSAERRLWGPVMTVMFLLALVVMVF